jgi:hypothetical protein
LIDAIAQAIQLQPTETIDTRWPLACQAGVEGCGFQIYAGGPGTVFLVCLAHGTRLRCTERLTGTTHETARREMNAAQGEASRIARPGA